MKTKPKIITKTILLLSLVSLLTDISSEMLYPIMPMFLKSIGFSVFYIGLLEGLAEAVAGFGKGFFGKLSDDTGKRVPFVRLGYFLSSISKPLMALLTYPIWIFFARTTDRIGKGVRTGARDAILSAETKPEFKGQVFGFHRAFDTIGAAIGPILALIFLQFYPGHYRILFLIAFLPAIAGVSFTFLLKEKQPAIPINTERGGFFSFLKYWKISTKSYKKLVLGLLVFALVNSSDIFLLLMAKHRGLPDEMVITVYIFYNLVYALFSQPLGRLADKIGLKFVFAAGLLLFALVYISMAFATTTSMFFGIFFLYGIYAACTEGVSKAWLTNISEKEHAATAIGFYTGWLSVLTLFSSGFAGLLWSFVSPIAPFVLSAIVSFSVALYLLLIFRGRKY